MILVTLGTHPQPMDRVVEWCDSLIADGTIDAAIIQAAAFGRQPERARAVDVLPVAELARLMGEATRIVTHGGPGSILRVLALGRRPIVIARDPALGEHVDSHQLRFVPWLAARREIAVASSREELRAALAEPDQVSRPDGPGGRPAARIRALIEDC
jgi:UDP-N-acetylglucosamine transferase subunit ALG13